MRLLPVLLLLSACATGPVCPPVVEYSYEFQQRLADEIEPLEDDSAVLQALLDYQTLRDVAQACR
jgi:hypothetical protein